MNLRARVAWANLPELDTVEKVKSKIKDHKLVVILFNERYPDSKSMETTFNWCRSIYENKHNVYCYKCVVSIGEDIFPTAFKIKELPTFIFFRNGGEIGRLEDADGPDPNAESIPKEEKNPMEYRLRTYLDKLCAEQS